jgi:serine/threonine protein kinase/Tfp pilus assembly protein PilF
MTLPTGTSLVNYDVISQLGVGGMGEVYRAHDTRLGRDVAIKVLPHEVSSSAERLARFEREARIVASLNHPNIVTLYSIEEVAGIRFIAMELVEGRSLADIIEPGGMPITQVLDVGVAIAEALEAAHRKGVVHRDLKPANVMLTADHRVKVLDFGLAKLVSSAAGSRVHDALTATSPLSSPGEAFGTAPYMAPEQLLGDDVDARTDLFAFGIVMFEMLAGHRPFAGRNFFETANTIANAPAPSLAGIRHEVPRELQAIVERCLEKAPDARFQAAIEVANALRALRRTLERGATLPAPQAPEAIASIAVLPFVNRSASQDDEYFSDGLADELLGLLAKINGLRVSARASSFFFRGQNVPLNEIGRALNVATVLDGSVRRSGNRVRISVQLVKVADGYHLWSETYDRTLDDIFAVQDDIARCVVKELRATLLGETADSEASDRARAEVSRAARGRATDPEAHRLFLLARHFMDQLNHEATAKAISYLKQAVARDPNFAHAWTELSLAYVRQAGIAIIDPAEGRALARQAVERAIEMEPSLSDAHVQMAWISIFHDWDWKAGERSVAKALALAPGSAPAIRLSGVLLYIHGRREEAVVKYRAALEHDPLSAAAYHSLGLVLYGMGDLVGAEDAFRKALELAPQRITTHVQLAFVILDQGRPEEALAEARREGEPSLRNVALAIVEGALNHPAESDAALKELIDKYALYASLQVAEVYATRGDADNAFEWLDRAHETRDVGLVHLKSNPRLRKLHGDPRWQAFLGRMRL